MSVNHVVLMGRIAQDIDLRYTQSNTAVCPFTIAVDRKMKKQDGTRETDFINCVSWGNTAEMISKFFNKGKMIAVSGSIHTRKYQDKNGNNRTAFEVNVTEVSFCGDKSNDEPARSPGYNTPVQSNDFAELGDDFSDVPF